MQILKAALAQQLGTRGCKAPLFILECLALAPDPFSIVRCEPALFH